MSKNALVGSFWKHLPFFLSVARQGSFNSAAAVIKADRTTIARRIEAIEQELSEKLFDRVDGRLVLTTFGRKLFVAAERAEQEMATAGLFATEGEFKGGRIRVSLPDHLLSATSALFRDFANEHPDILLQIVATDRFVDLHQFEADIAFRITSAVPRSLSLTRIARPQFSLFKPAGSDLNQQFYLARPAEQEVPDYLGRYMPNARIGMSVDGLLSMKELIASGAGAGILPDYLGRGDPKIELCSAPLPSRDLFLAMTHLPEIKNLHRIKVFAAFMVERMRSVLNS